MAKPVFMTPKVAAEYSGIDAQTIKRAMVDPKYASIFEGNTDYLTFEDFGVSYKPVKRATKDAIDRLVAARSAAAATGKLRASRGKGRRETIYVTDDQRDQVIAALAQFGITFAPKRETKRQPKSTIENKPAESNGQVFEHELVEA